MKNHLVVDDPMIGGKWGIATVTRGEHTGKDVCIMVEFSDGWCICDMGNDDPIQTIKIEDMALWVSVQVVKSPTQKRADSLESTRKRWNRLRKILVESWPEWKKNVLTYSSQSERSR